jgi:hypothetical protein
MRSETSLLIRTQQMWKLTTLAMGSLSSMMILLAAIWEGDSRSPRICLPLVLLATIVSAISLIVPYYIRCPRCRTSWFWVAMKTSKLSREGGWYRALRSQSICPVCSYPAADRRVQ